MHSDDRSRFDLAIAKLLHAADGTIKPQAIHTDTYWNILKPYPLPKVLRAMQDALNESTGHVTPAELRSRILSRDGSEHPAVRAEREREANRPVEPRREPTEYDQMLMLANAAYARRVNRAGGPDLVDVFSGGNYHEYTGSFDYMQVVDAVPIPPHRSRSADEDRSYWATFWRVLREEWDATRAPVSPDIGR